MEERAPRRRTWKRFEGSVPAISPSKVNPLWDKQGSNTGSAIVQFAKDWSGFTDANDFENFFEVQGCGKRHWKGQKYGKAMLGWVARAEDYRDPIAPSGPGCGDTATLKLSATLKPLLIV